MSVQLLERLTNLGKDMGYAGLELREWVTAQVKIEEKKSADAFEREERRIQREEQKNEAEAERIDRRKREEIALEHAKLEQAEKLKIMELEQQKEVKLTELKLAEKKLDNSNAEAANDSDSDGSQASHASSSSRRGSRRKAGPKLPHFDEHKDNIDSYLRRFERYAALQDWEANDWAIYLSALLKGKALEVYCWLTETEARSYTTLKSTLLRKYQLTVEGFRRQFYAAKREKDETASQFVC